VISRVSPEQKLQIALALQARGHVVAMTGDGVNDGPALQTADVGVAMGRGGTDVAREAASVVLLDDDFSTIVMAIEQGRTVYGNIRRFLTYHLTDNVAELTPFLVWALSGGRIPLAISVLQVLSLDIGTDLLPALALGVEPPHHGAQPIATGRLLDRKVLARAFGWLGPTEAVMEMSAFFAALLATGWRPGSAFPAGQHLAMASGAAFSAVVLGQLANAFACRSDRTSAWRVDAPRNTALIAATAVEFALLMGFLGIGPVARLLGQTWPGIAGGAVALATIPAVLLADAVAKGVARRRVSASA
jgi:magnesium-transporting ATPase (P-type)